MSDYYKTAEDFKANNGYDIDGLWYPRVTRIISIKSKPGLSNFYNEMGSSAAAAAVTQKSAEEGTMVHEAVEAILLGQNPEIPEIISPAVGAFRSFLEAKDIEVAPENVELRIHHPEHRYAGTIDVVARINGKLGVLDIKTSQAIYRDYNLQTAAYVEALLDELPLETRWILRIDQNSKCFNCGATKRVKGGREKIKPARGYEPCKEHDWCEVEGIVEVQEFPDWKSDFEAFLGAKRLWEWENEWWLKRIGYI